MGAGRSAYPPEMEKSTVPADIPMKTTHIVKGSNQIGPRLVESDVHSTEGDAKTTEETAITEETATTGRTEIIGRIGKMEICFLRGIRLNVNVVRINLFTLHQLKTSKNLFVVAIPT